MELSEIIQNIHQLDEKARELNAIKVRLIDEIDKEHFPYKAGQVVLCQGNYHTGKPGRVIRSRLFKTKFSWTAKVVVMCIGDDGYDMHPTDWASGVDHKLQEFINTLNEIDPPKKTIDKSIKKEMDYNFSTDY